MAKCEETSTFDSFADFKSYDRNIYYSELSVFEKSIDGNSMLLSYNILNDYKDEIMELAVPLTLNDSEFIKYKYNPKLLAYDLYGSTEYYYIILFINSMASVKEFNRKKIKLLYPNELSQIISSIYSSEEQYLNRSKLILKEE